MAVHQCSPFDHLHVHVHCLREERLNLFEQAKGEQDLSERRRTARATFAQATRKASPGIAGEVNRVHSDYMGQILTMTFTTRKAVDAGPSIFHT